MVYGYCPHGGIMAFLGGCVKGVKRVVWGWGATQTASGVALHCADNLVYRFLNLCNYIRLNVTNQNGKPFNGNASYLKTINSGYFYQTILF